MEVLPILAYSTALAKLLICLAERVRYCRAAEITLRVFGILTSVNEEKGGTAPNSYQFSDKRCVGVEKPIQ